MARRYARKMNGPPVAGSIQASHVRELTLGVINR